MTPEEKARQQIDAMLTASGWVVQTKDKINLSAARGVAICELSFTTGEPDYTLFVDGKALGTTEAKPEGHSLIGVEEQSTKYVSGAPSGLPAWRTPLPFCYESTGTETHFTNRLDPFPRSRNVFAFHRPETLLAWLQHVAGGGSPLAQRLREMPPLATGSLWLAQIQAITGLELSQAKALRRALIQMATGSGKTYTAVNFTYRLIKYAGARRVLFLVDRGNLGRQTLKEFQQFGPHPVDTLWHAYELAAEGHPRPSDGRGAGGEGKSVSSVKSVVKQNPACRFADLVALVRFTLEQQPVLEPFAESVTTRFNEWLMDKAKAASQLSTINHQPTAPVFTPEQLSWLNLIRDHIATSLSIEPDDFESVPFLQRGGLGKAHQLFGEQLPKLLDELNTVLAA